MQHPTTAFRLRTVKIKEEAKPEEAIYEHESGTKILPSSLSINELKDIKTEKLSEITKKLEKLYDFFETTLFKSLTEKDGARLSHQAHHMQAYADILQARIRDFSE